jgi:hypothetical protein
MSLQTPLAPPSGEGGTEHRRASPLGASLGQRYALGPSGLRGLMLLLSSVLMV